MRCWWGSGAGLKGIFQTRYCVKFNKSQCMPAKRHRYGNGRKRIFLLDLKIHWEGKTYSTLFMAVICPFVTIVKEVVKVTSLYQIQLTPIFLNSCQGHRFFSPKYPSCPMLSVESFEIVTLSLVLAWSESVESGSWECKIQQIILTGCLAITVQWIKPGKTLTGT